MTPDGVAAAYDAGAQRWSSGPEALYARLAAAMLRIAAITVRDARVLDLGAGTGVASRAALEAGAAQAVAVDIAAAMLRRRGPGIAPVVADAARLPFPAGTFDLVLSACCLSHLPDPQRAIHEARRVGAVLVASAFAPGWTHPAKAAVEVQTDCKPLRQAGSGQLPQERTRSWASKQNSAALPPRTRRDRLIAGHSIC
jgi:ubiquinone/menaquinone biosynthesis C-methylase UbiE